MTVASTPIVTPARLRNRELVVDDELVLHANATESKDSCCFPILEEDDPNRVSKSVSTLRQANTISSEDLSSDDDEEGGEEEVEEGLLLFMMFLLLVCIPSINR